MHGWSRASITRSMSWGPTWLPCSGWPSSFFCISGLAVCGQSIVQKREAKSPIRLNLLEDGAQKPCLPQHDEDYQSSKHIEDVRPVQQDRRTEPISYHGRYKHANKNREVIHHC